jgi:hypothetical protein
MTRQGGRDGRSGYPQRTDRCPFLLRKISDYSRATTFFLLANRRPIMYGLALVGEEDFEQVLRRLLTDTEVTLGLSGYKGIYEILG